MADKDKFADEVMSDDELDNVAGGACGETGQDSRFLNVLLRGNPAQCDRYGAWRISVESHEDEIKKAWAAVGVDAEIDGGNYFILGKSNSYSINGKKVTRDEAYQHAMNVVGKQMSKSDWNW